jgi:MFS superfamily sulfate permease-like transporter
MEDFFGWLMGIGILIYIAFLLVKFYPGIVLAIGLVIGGIFFIRHLLKEEKARRAREEGEREAGRAREAERRWLIPLTQVALDVVSLTDRLVAVARMDTDGEGAVTCRIPGGIFRRGELRGVPVQAALA